MEKDQQYQYYSEKLLQDEAFISKLQSKVNGSLLFSKENLHLIVQELADLLEHLIKLKIEREMSELIEDNNRILEEIKNNFELARNSSNHHHFSPKRKGGEGENSPSFTDIHNLISEEKRKMNDQFTDAELEKSISIIDRYEDVVDKVYDVQKRVKGMEDRYETNFKSLWNVLSMTEAAVFEHIKQNRDNKVEVKKHEGKEKEKKNESTIFTFWK